MTSKESKILVVDDLVEMVRVMQETIECGGYNNVVSFTDSREAKKYLLENEIDVLVTDLQMPEVSGIELIDLAFKMKVRRIIAVSGMVQKSESLDKALKTLGVTLIGKPYKIEDVLEAIGG